MVRVKRCVRMRMRVVSYTLSMYRYFLPTNIQRFGMSRLYVVGLIISGSSFILFCDSSHQFDRCWEFANVTKSVLNVALQKRQFLQVLGIINTCDQICRSKSVPSSDQNWHGGTKFLLQSWRVKKVWPTNSVNPRHFNKFTLYDIPHLNPLKLFIKNLGGNNCSTQQKLNTII